MKAPEIKFIQWFKDNVRSDQSSIVSDKQFIGELNEQEFWLQPKAPFIQKQPYWDWTFKELNIIIGNYKNVNGIIRFNIQIQIKSWIRNLLVGGTISWLIIGYYLFTYHNSFIGIELTLGFSLLLFMSIWRLKRDAEFFQNLLISELN